MKLIYENLRENYDADLYETPHDSSAGNDLDRIDDKSLSNLEGNETEKRDDAESVQVKCKYNPVYHIDTNLYYDALIDELFFWSIFKLFLFWYNSQNNDGDNSDIEWVSCVTLMLTMVGPLYCLLRCICYSSRREKLDSKLNSSSFVY